MIDPNYTNTEIKALSSLSKLPQTVKVAELGFEPAVWFSTNESRNGRRRMGPQGREPGRVWSVFFTSKGLPALSHFAPRKPIL